MHACIHASIIHTCIHLYTHTHANIHACMHARTHHQILDIETSVYIHMCVNVHMGVDLNVHVHTVSTLCIYVPHSSLPVLRRVSLGLPRIAGRSLDVGIKESNSAGLLPYSKLMIHNVAKLKSQSPSLNGGKQYQTVPRGRTSGTFPFLAQLNTPPRQQGAVYGVEMEDAGTVFSSLPVPQN